MTLRLSIISFRGWKCEVELLANEMWVCGLHENCSVVKALQPLLFINKHKECFLNLLNALKRS